MKRCTVRRRRRCVAATACSRIDEPVVGEARIAGSATCPASDRRGRVAAAGPCVRLPAAKQPCAWWAGDRRSQPGTRARCGRRDRRVWSHDDAGQRRDRRHRRTDRCGGCTCRPHDVGSGPHARASRLRAPFSTTTTPTRISTRSAISSGPARPAPTSGISRFFC